MAIPNEIYNSLFMNQSRHDDYLREQQVEAMKKLLSQQQVATRVIQPTNPNPEPNPVLLLIEE